MDHSALDDRSLCDNCRKIDFTCLLNNPSDSLKPGNHLFNLKYSQHCALCRMLSNGYTGARKLGSVSFLSSMRWSAKEVPGRAEEGVLLNTTTGDFEWFQANSGYIFCVPPGSTSHGLLKPKVVPQIYEYEAARSWLHNCQQFHGSQCTVASSNIEGLHVIDCKTMTIVRANPDTRWIALSYVWGSPAPQPSQAEGSQNVYEGSPLPANIAPTIKDAITVTKQLGYQFLWVDEFCINQKDENHRQNQISKMDQIYQSADLTIVAAAGENKHCGLPGVSAERANANPIFLKEATIFSIKDDPLEQIPMSKWFKRAWTFQEGVLSRRLLVFTDQQMSFYCHGATWMECLGGPRYIDQAAVDWTRWPIQESLFQSMKSRPAILTTTNLSRTAKDNARYLLMDLARFYTRRLLTFESDALNAFSGVMNSFSQSEAPVFNISGLPYCCWGNDEPVESAEQTVLRSLSWMNVNTNSPRRRMFQSWTWAGWVGPVDFVPYRESNATIQEVEFESLSGPTFKPSELLKCNSWAKLQSMLDTIHGIHFQAPEILVNYRYEQDQHLLVIGDRVFSMTALSSRIHDNLNQNCASGIWSCLVLGILTFFFREDIFVLLVEWKDQETAERVDGFLMDAHDNGEDNFMAVAKDLKMRKVRLV